MAILAGAMVMHQLARHEPRWVIVTLDGCLPLLAALLPVGAYRQWRQYQHAMRHMAPLPPSKLVPLLAVSATVLGIVGMAAMALS